MNDPAHEWPATIAHVDLDCFFAQAETLDDPSLRGKPVIVGPTPPVRREDGTFEPIGRGIVSTSNYEARAFGVRTAMPAAQAQRLCPHAVFVKPRGSRYKELSQAVFRSLEDLTPVVRPVGIDEAYLDLAGLESSFVHGELQRALPGRPGDTHDAQEERASWVHRFAIYLQEHVLSSTGLDISVGIGPNRFIAKLASDYNKPRGVHVVPVSGCARFCRSLDMRDLRGVGPATAERLAALGYRTPGHVLDSSREDIAAVLGDTGVSLFDAMHGEAGSVPSAREQRKSISRDKTFAVNVSASGSGRSELLAVATGLLERAMHSLRREALRTRTLGVRIRYADFETVQHDESLSQLGGPGVTDLDSDLIPRLPSLIDSCLRRGSEAQRRSGIRLIGVKLSNLTEHSGRQGGLFEQTREPERTRVYRAVDEIRSKLGAGAVRSGGSLRSTDSSTKPDRDSGGWHV